MNCRCLTFQDIFCIVNTSQYVNTGSCRSLLGHNKFGYFLRVSFGGANQASVIL